MNVNSMSAIAMRMPLALTLLEASVATATLALREMESTAQVSETMESSCPLYPLLCIDIDECELGFDDCNENATCTDTLGSFSCACNPGFEGDGLNCTSNPMIMQFCNYIPNSQLRLKTRLYGIHFTLL